MREDNRKIFETFYEAMNRHDEGRVREIMSTDFIDHAETEPEMQGPEGVIQWCRQVWQAMPDVHMQVHQVVAEDDTVAGRIRTTGTHTGEFFGIPPTGRSVDFDTYDIVRFADGKAVEHWGLSDRAAFYSQIGLAPAEGVIETVQACYQAFGEGDIDTILGLLADDVRFMDDQHAHGVPWLRERHGRDEVRAFFRDLAENVSFERFEIQSMLASGQEVCAVVATTSTLLPTGRRLSDDHVAHLWRIEDGKVASFISKGDTHAMVEGLRA